MIDYRLPSGHMQAGVPIEVGCGTGYFWFPSLHRIGDDTLVCAIIRSADVAQGKWPADLYVSKDSAATWRLHRAIDSYGHTSVRCDGATTLMMPYELWPVAVDDKRNGVAPGNVLTVAADGALVVDEREVRFCDFPRALADAHEGEIMLHHTGNILRLGSGSLFTMLYGRFDGDEELNNFAVASDDGGFNWRYLSTVADGSAAPGAPEGPNESDALLLDNGDLLCVYRVSGEWDFCKSYSSDEGRTWSSPERMRGIWSVQPRLAKLGNGALVLTGGRPGLLCYLCADGKGEVWERVNLGAHHNELVEREDQRYSAAFCRAEQEDPAISTSYTSVMPLGDDQLIVVYDRLANGWSEAPGRNGEVSSVFSVVLKVSI